MKNINIAYCVVALLAVATPTASSVAQPKGPPPRDQQGSQPSLPDPLSAAASRWDLNQDGVFTCDEWKQFVSGVFYRADKNRDGFLSASELNDLRNSERVFASADISYFDDNRDRRVSKSEFIEKPNPFFSRYDLNHDCRVTAEEIKGPSAAAAKDKDRPAKGGPMGMPGRGGF